MKELMPEAERLLERYVNRMRLSLRGTSVEAGEVEKDIRAHIEEALKDEPAPIETARMDEVLERLGRPDQWVPEEEVPEWRKVIARFSWGPEDWRLAYLSFALTILGLITVPVGGVILLAGAVFLSRASIALAEERGEPLGARRWLLYPPLVLLSVLLISIPLAGPVAGFAGLAVEGVESGVLDLSTLGADSMAGVAAVVVAVSGIWFVVLAGIAALAARPIRWMLVPIADGFRPRHSAWIALFGILLIAGSAAYLMI